MGAHSLPKRERLKSPQEYSRVFKEGCSYKSSNLILRVLPNGLLYNRLGIALAKGIAAGSVSRNYARRVLKESYRITKPHGKKGFDIVALALKSPLPFQDSKKDMIFLLKKAGIL